jgi:hypothetical protein
MSPAPRPSPADFLGFLAYLFVVGGGRLERDDVVSAARLALGASGRQQPAPALEPRPPQATSEPATAAPLLAPPTPAREREEALVRS